MKSFIVASNSPRRRELLSLAGYEFEVIPSDTDETLEADISAETAVKELAKRKALSVSAQNTFGSWNFSPLFFRFSRERYQCTLISIFSQPIQWKPNKSPERDHFRCRFLLL